MIDDSCERAEFAQFRSLVQIYIVRALDLGLPRNHPMERWHEGGPVGMAMLLARADAYRHLGVLREELQDCKQVGPDFRYWDAIRKAVRFDVQHEEMGDIAAFRFLYERLLGPPIRPWITSLYLAAVTEPDSTSEWKERCLASVTAADLDDHDDKSMPLFFPDIVDLLVRR